MMQQKVRKKNRAVLMLTQEKSETWLFRYIKEANLKGVRSWNKLKSLRSLVILKCGRRTSLHAVQYKWQSGSVLMSCLYSVRNGQPSTFFLCSAGREPGFVLSSFSIFFTKSKACCGVDLVIMWSENKNLNQLYFTSLSPSAAFFEKFWEIP